MAANPLPSRHSPCASCACSARQVLAPSPAALAELRPHATRGQRSEYSGWWLCEWSANSKRGGGAVTDRIVSCTQQLVENHKTQLADKISCSRRHADHGCQGVLPPSARGGGVSGNHKVRSAASPASATSFAHLTVASMASRHQSGQALLCAAARGGVRNARRACNKHAADAGPAVAQPLQ